MFWAGVATVVQLLTHSTEEVSEPNASDATDSSELQEISSTQRESSDTISQVSLEEWPHTKSSSTGSSFSEAMSDCVTADQQQREEQNVMALNHPYRKNLSAQDNGSKTKEVSCIAQLQPNGCGGDPCAHWMLRNTQSSHRSPK